MLGELCSLRLEGASAHLQGGRYQVVVLSAGACGDADGTLAEWSHPANEEGARGPAISTKEVAESQPWSVAEWAVAPRFDNPRATGLVLVLG